MRSEGERWEFIKYEERFYVSVGGLEVVGMSVSESRGVVFVHVC